jgi:hypothetical protein
MKTKKFTITIPEPCTENWNEMTPTARGKFCAHCQKDVIDFSDKTDLEIANFVKSNKGNFCGRFIDKQLDKEFSYIEQEKNSTLKYAAALALGLLTAENAMAQDEKTKIEIQPINAIETKPIQVSSIKIKDSNSVKNNFHSDSNDIFNCIQSITGGVRIISIEVKDADKRKQKSSDISIFDMLRRLNP